MNLSQLKRQKLLEFLEKLKDKNDDDESRMLLNEIEIALTEKKYGLVWEKHIEKVDKELKHKIPIFKEIKEKKIISNKDEKYNFLLEGDNLHSLKLLEKTYEEKIDVIYIDPPYNTGNKDFMYDDKIVDKNDGYSHSKWISFMNERLIIAKKLLKSSGVIFISIDDNEQAQLKLLCDEIFGEKNFESIIWKKKGGAGNTEKILGNLTEYILCFFKNKKSGIFNYRELERTYKYKDEKGFYNLEGLEKTNQGIYKRETMLFEVINPKTGKVFKPQKNKRWILGQNTFLKYIEEEKIFFDDKKNKVYRIKREEDYKNSENVYYNLLTDLGSLSTAKDELKKIINDRELFETPKPTKLIKHLLEISTKKNSIILDFFAGSGTTGHAVAKLNKEDGGKRTYILCTNNENKICEEITYKRLKNIQEELPHNLKYYKTDFIPKYSEDENDKLVSSKMLDNLKELIELEYKIEIDGIKNIIIKNEEELKNKIESIEEKSNIFLCSGIFLNKKQQRILEEKNIKVIDVPEYYFKSELKELGEI